MIEDTTLLRDAFKNEASHTQMIQRDGSLAGIIHMRDVLAVYQQFGSLDEKTVGQHMNEAPITIPKTDNLLKPARIFVEHKIKSVLVIDEQTGEVSNLGPQQLIENLPSGLLGFYQPLAQVMVRNPKTIQADVTLDKAISTLVEQRFSCLPVCDAEDQLIGLVSESDLLRAVINDLDKNTPVSEIMIDSPISITEQSNLQQTWETMCQHGVMKVFVLAPDGSLTGLVTATDVLIALCKSLLSTFAIYHCPEGTDMLVEWRKHGMIMAVSNALITKLGCEAEDLIGLHWANGLSEYDQLLLLKLPKTETVCISWNHDGKPLSFDVSRDIEQAAMWWKLS